MAGTPLESVTRAVAADLEKRGFVVFVVVGSVEEERAVLEENRPDIRPLWIDVTSVRASTPTSFAESSSRKSVLTGYTCSPHRTNRP